MTTKTSGITTASSHTGMPSKSAPSSPRIHRSFFVAVEAKEYVKPYRSCPGTCHTQPRNSREVPKRNPKHQPNANCDVAVQMSKFHDYPPYEALPRLTVAWPANPRVSVTGWPILTNLQCCSDASPPKMAITRRWTKDETSSHSHNFRTHHCACRSGGLRR